VGRIIKFEESRRRFLTKALSISAISSSFTHLKSCSLSPSSLDLSRSIYKLGGQVHINGQLATLKFHINPGDSIITGKKSHIIFAFSGESFILQSNSTIKLGDPEPLALALPVSISYGAKYSQSLRQGSRY
jgi:hypothetical protein